MSSSKLAAELDEFWLSLVRLGPLDPEPLEEEPHRLKVLALADGETGGHCVGREKDRGKKSLFMTDIIAKWMEILKYE